MIKLENISKSYNKKQNVVENINIEIKDGEILGFLGSNGAGKTTIIKMISGILEIDKGNIYVDDIDISKNPYDAKKKIGLVLDNPNMFLNLKGIEYLNFIADMYEIDKNIRRDRIIKWSKKFNMEEALLEKIESYSHGMRQKIVLIGVLVHEPKNWILDEPITGLDPKAIYDLKNIMREYVQKGNTVFFSTHILEVAENLCDRVCIINKGKIFFIGKIEELKNKLNTDKTLEKIFMEIIEDV